MRRVAGAIGLRDGRRAVSPPLPPSARSPDRGDQPGLWGGGSTGRRTPTISSNCSTAACQCGLDDRLVRAVRRHRTGTFGSSASPRRCCPGRCNPVSTISCRLWRCRLSGPLPTADVMGSGGRCRPLREGRAGHHDDGLWRNGGSRRTSGRDNWRPDPGPRRLRRRQQSSRAGPTGMLWFANTAPSARSQRLHGHRRQRFADFSVGVPLPRNTAPPGVRARRGFGAVGHRFDPPADGATDVPRRMLLCR